MKYAYIWYNVRLFSQPFRTGMLTKKNARRETNQRMFRLLWNIELHQRVRKSTQLVSILSQLNRPHTQNLFP
jgi:hypothetical protein